MLFLLMFLWQIDNYYLFEALKFNNLKKKCVNSMAQFKFLTRRGFTYWNQNDTWGLYPHTLWRPKYKFLERLILILEKLTPFKSSGGYKLHLCVNYKIFYESKIKFYHCKYILIYYLTKIILIFKNQLFYFLFLTN